MPRAPKKTATRKAPAIKPDGFACLNCGALHSMPELCPTNNNAEHQCHCGFRSVFEIKGNALECTPQTAPLPQHIEALEAPTV